MADQWYLTIRTPTPSVDVWRMGEEPAVDDEPAVTQRAAEINAAKALLSVPYEWPELGGWSVTYGPGEPHPSIMAGAVFHDGPPET